MGLGKGHINVTNTSGSQFRFKMGGSKFRNKKVEGNSGMTACLSKLGMITDMLRISVWENLLLYWSVDQYNK